MVRRSMLMGASVWFVALCVTGCSAADAPVPRSTTTAGAAATVPPDGLHGSQPADRLPAGDDTSVTRIVDGDTIVTGLGKVRLIGVDTPETVDPRRPVGCFGHEASAFTASLLPVGTPVRLVYDVDRRDRYGRLLAYVYRVSDALFVNAALMIGGYAQVLTVPPDVAHARDFLALQRAARDAGRGLWSACDR